jgi:hypothetical protein
MLRGVLVGTLAGAAGTVALNIVTYADMAVRGRPASEPPPRSRKGSLPPPALTSPDEMAQASKVEMPSSGTRWRNSVRAGWAR